jgi:ubiquinone/menaquinone biosynthesis C-methylase UbiE
MEAAVPATDKEFTGSIPEFYDRFFVPLIFEPYAADIARRIATLRPNRILEVAAGTGVVTRAVVAALPETDIVATDLNQPMIDHAKSRQSTGRVAWQKADALALPFPDASFDAVVCQFGMMFFPDKVKGFSEAHRVLRDGGSYIFNVWDKIEANEFVDVIMRALAEVFPHNPPQFMQRTPHGFHDNDVIRGDVKKAGFRHTTIEPMEAMSRAESAQAVVVAYCQGSPLKLEIEERGAPGLEAAMAKATEALVRRFGPGPVAGKIRAYVVTAHK